MITNMNENEWTLEQRLASHLSRALNQENDANPSQSNQSIEEYMDPALTGANQWSSGHNMNANANAFANALRAGTDPKNSYSHSSSDQDSILSQASVSRLLDFINQPQDDGSKDQHKTGLSSLTSSTLQSHGLNIPASLQSSAYTPTQQSLAHQQPSSYNANQLQQTLASNAVNAQYTANLLSSQIQTNALNAQLKSNLLNSAATPSSYTATPQFEIDSEVADIRNVLQSLLDPNVANKVLTDQSAQPQTSLNVSTSTIHGINAATSRSLLGTDLSGLTSTTDFSNITLSAETESLRAKIEASLRKEFNIPAVTPTQSSSVAPPTAAHTQLPRPDTTAVKRTYRRRKPSVEYNSPPPSDLNAETDTLRAIQQALLGAINPASAAEPESHSSSSSNLSRMPDIAFDGSSSHQSSPDKESEDLQKGEKVQEKSKSQEPSKDDEFHARLIKRANATYGANASREKEMYINNEIARQKRKINIQDSITAILAKEKVSGPDGPKSSLDSVHTRLELLPTTRRLAKHTKEAASNHLSQLFKKSNSILEPRMQKEKATAPVSPYILMSFPKRPKFRVQMSQQDKPSDAETTSEEPEKRIPETSESASNIEPAQNTQTGPSTARDSANSEPEDEPTVEFVHTKRVQSMRPKHKYSLIGRLDFGAPPNLAAIMAKHQM